MPTVLEDAVAVDSSPYIAKSIGRKALNMEDVAVGIFAAVPKQASQPRPPIAGVDDYIRILCDDDRHEFSVPEDVLTYVSDCVKTMLIDNEDKFLESRERTIRFPSIHHEVMENVLEFCFRYYIESYAFSQQQLQQFADLVSLNNPDSPTDTLSRSLSSGTGGRLKVFFQFEIRPEFAIDLIAAAHFLGIAPLLDLALKFVAHHISAVSDLTSLLPDHAMLICSYLTPQELCRVEQRPDFRLLHLDTTEVWKQWCNKAGIKMTDEDGQVVQSGRYGGGRTADILPRRLYLEAELQKRADELRASGLVDFLDFISLCSPHIRTHGVRPFAVHLASSFPPPPPPPSPHSNSRYPRPSPTSSALNNTTSQTVPWLCYLAYLPNLQFVDISGVPLLESSSSTTTENTPPPLSPTMKSPRRSTTKPLSTTTTPISSPSKRSLLSTALARSPSRSDAKSPSSPRSTPIPSPSPTPTPNPVSPEVLPLYFESHPMLVSVDLTSTGLRDDAVALLARAVGSHPRLQKLTLASNVITSVSLAPLLDAVGQSLTLRELDLSGCNIDTIYLPLPELTSFSRSTSLHLLSLRQNHLSSSRRSTDDPSDLLIAPQLFAFLPTSLRVLDLSYCNMCTEDVTFLAMGLNKGMWNLETLLIDESEAGVRGCHALMEYLTTNTSVRRFSLALNELPRSTVMDIVRMLSINHTLTSLDLSGTLYKAQELLAVTRAWAESVEWRYSNPLGPRHASQPINIPVNTPGSVAHRAERTTPDSFSAGAVANETYALDLRRNRETSNAWKQAAENFIRDTHVKLVS